MANFPRTMIVHARTNMNCGTLPRDVFLDAFVHINSDLSK